MGRECKYKKLNSSEMTVMTHKAGGSSEKKNNGFKRVCTKITIFITLNPPTSIDWFYRSVQY